VPNGNAGGGPGSEPGDDLEAEPEPGDDAETLDTPEESADAGAGDAGSGAPDAAGDAGGEPR
jgi:hypothetical protein